MVLIESVAVVLQWSLTLEWGFLDLAEKRHILASSRLFLLLLLGKRLLRAAPTRDVAACVLVGDLKSRPETSSLDLG